MLILMIAVIVLFVIGMDKNMIMIIIRLVVMIIIRLVVMIIVIVTVVVKINKCIVIITIRGWGYGYHLKERQTLS